MNLSPLALAFLTLALAGSALADVASGKQAVAATVHPVATKAALEAMQQGGNAVDAAVAAALTLGVVDGHNSGIGGGCFILLRLANGDILAVDGRETAPLAAHRSMYVVNGQVNPRLSQVGALAIGVPGALAAYNYTLERYGRLPLRTHLLKAATLAERGFKLDANYARRLKSAAPDLRLFPESARTFLDPQGQPWPEGHRLRLPDLARTYRNIAEQGVAWFYHGPFAVATAQWMVANQGLLTVDDFALYSARRRPPIITTYRDFTIAGFPPPSSGGVHVAQILNMLETFDLKEKGPSPESAHLIVEAMKRAFADRAYWLGDPDFVSVPRGLIGKPYARRLAAQIEPKKVAEIQEHGKPPEAEEDTFGDRHTTHFTAADAAGNWIACTATINTAFGSKVVIPGTGVVMNNEMDDFAAQPGVPNFFGLVGAEANSIQPRKRPLSSMSPTIVLQNGRPLLSLGAAGGPTIISQVVLGIINHIDFDLSLPDAIARPRFHHQWMPDTVKIEKSIPQATREGLESLGHELNPVDSIGVMQGIGINRETRSFIGVADPRVQGKALGLPPQ